MGLRVRTALGVRKAFGALAGGSLLVAALTLSIGSPAVAQSTVPATPTCSGGAELNAATGRCERPPILVCPTGMTLSGHDCTAPSTCPAGTTGPENGTCTDPAAGPRMFRVSCPTGGQAIGASNTCTDTPTPSCPAGQTLNGPLCTAAPVYRCPPGATLSGTQCVMPPPAPAPTAAVPTTLARVTPVAAAPSQDAGWSGAPASNRSGLRLAATGSRSRPALGLAGWAFVAGGALLLASTPALRRDPTARTATP